MNIYLPGFEPDAAERAQLRFINGVLDLRQFDKIFISVSGGKDSHAMLFSACASFKSATSRTTVEEALRLWFKVKGIEVEK